MGGRSYPSADGHPETKKCHSEPSEESCSASGRPPRKDQGEIPRLARNDNAFQDGISRRDFMYSLGALALPPAARTETDLILYNANVLDGVARPAACAGYCHKRGPIHRSRFKRRRPESCHGAHPQTGRRREIRAAGFHRCACSPLYFRSGSSAHGGARYEFDLGHPISVAQACGPDARRRMGAGIPI